MTLMVEIAFAVFDDKDGKAMNMNVNLTFLCQEDLLKKS